MLQEYLASRAWQRVPAALAVITTPQIPCLPVESEGSQAQCIMFPGIDTYRRTKGHCLQSRNYRKKEVI